MTSTEIHRSKDGVPQWDGDSVSFQDYEEQALQWEQGIPYHKRYLAGPKLVAELSGPARRYVMGKRPQWLSFNGGVLHLLQHLRECLGRPTIPEMTEYLNKYFRHSRRRRFENMNTYITRKVEVYHRARQSLARVQQFFGKHHRDHREHEWQQRRWSQSSWDDWQGTNWQRQPDQEEHDEEEQWYDPPSEAPDAPSWHQSQTSYGYGYNPVDDEPWKLNTDELLPEFLQGWYLLADAGLDSTEKNMIQTAIQEDFSVQRVAKELRLQWPDEELKKRDQQAKHAGFWADEPEATSLPPEADLLEDAWWLDDLTGEGQALFNAAEERAQEAFALIEQGRRTLKEARARQHQVKLSRQYYKTTFRRGGGDPPRHDRHSYAPRGDGAQGVTCLRCGKGHRTSECPEKPQDQKNQGHVTITEEAPFVCFTEEALTVNGLDTARTTQEAVLAGCAVIDGGATKTLGSVAAIQAVMDQNLGKHGESRIQAVDPQNQPQFGFGNGSQDKCISTTQLKVTANDRPGALQIHALDRGQGPILLSIQTLRALKAVIDFDEDLLVLRGLDATKVIPLERSAAGHQLLPLTEDLFKHAHTCKKQVPSLREYI